MSAIAGLWSFDGRPDTADRCARMLAAQEIYGPHDGKLFADGAIAMGRRLYRTLPEDIHDRGPLRSADGRLALVADVRLDNRDELSVDLGLSRERERKLSDSHVLLACLEKWEEGALDRMVGVFAFALWDDGAQKLLLVRDFAGERPLHYHCGRDFFAFASMPKGLHALPEVPRAPDEQVMAEFLALLPVDRSSSYFKDVRRVAAGQVVTVTRHGIARRDYWNPVRPSGRRLKSEDYVEGLRHHLDQATRARLRGGNGKIATHLSAGFDSSSVTATAARLMSAEGGKVVAFTSVPREGYSDAAPRGRFGDEGPLAAQTAALYPNIEHVLIRSGHLSPLDNLDRGFFLFDRPVLNLCNFVWATAINKAARERGIGVLLTGAMGNMTVSYEGVEWLPELLRSGRLVKLAQLSAALLRNREKGLGGILAQTFAPYLPSSIWRFANKVFRDRDWNILEYSAIRRERLDALNLEEIARARALDFSYRPRKDGFATRIWVMRRTDSGNYNKGNLAGWGIDSRDPMSDRRLFEFCLSVPMSEYVAGGVLRSLAKRALADRLPVQVLRERKKGLQAIDWHEGMSAARSEIVTELDRIADCGPASSALDVERLRSLAENWPQSGWQRESVTYAYRLAMLRGIAAGHFLRKAAGSNS